MIFLGDPLFAFFRLQPPDLCEQAGNFSLITVIGVVAANLHLHGYIARLKPDEASHGPATGSDDHVFLCRLP